MLKPLEDLLRFPDMKAKKKWVLAGQPSRKDLVEICDVLNSKTEKGASELRSLVGRWFASGPNLKQMLHPDSALWTAVQNSWSSLYLPTKKGRAYIALFPDIPSDEKATAEDEAHLLFAALTLNPECNLLAGPCARCGDYYIKKTRRQKVYCSQKCGSAATALRTVRKKREVEHQRKITLARKVLSRWKPTNQKERWQDWVSQRSSLTVKWLSRAANKGDLPLHAK